MCRYGYLAHVAGTSLAVTHSSVASISSDMMMSPFSAPCRSPSSRLDSN